MQAAEPGREIHVPHPTAKDCKPVRSCTPALWRHRQAHVPRQCQGSRALCPMGHTAVSPASAALGNAHGLVHASLQTRPAPTGEAAREAAQGLPSCQEPGELQLPGSRARCKPGYPCASLRCGEEHSCAQKGSAELPNSLTQIQNAHRNNGN